MFMNSASVRYRGGRGVVRRDIQFEANMKGIFIRFEVNINFALKQIGGFTCKTNKNGSEYFFLSEYFQKEPNIN